MSQALGSGSQPWPHMKITPGILKDPSARLYLVPVLSESSGDGHQDF